LIINFLLELYVNGKMQLPGKMGGIHFVFRSAFFFSAYGRKIEVDF